jgi:hypothetical protein
MRTAASEAPRGNADFDLDVRIQPIVRTGSEAKPTDAGCPDTPSVVCTGGACTVLPA